MRLTILFLLVAFSANSQLNCSIKLIDSYSNKEIKIDNSFRIKNGIFQIDTLNNSILLTKLKGKHLIIESNLYCLYDEKFDKKELKNSIKKLQLRPNDHLIEIKFNEIWNSDNIPSDTLIFNNHKELENHILTYISYLSFAANTCDNGMCHYANTYFYQIKFKANDTIYQIDEVKKLQPVDIECELLENSLQLFKTIFPKFKIKNEKQEFYLNFHYF